MNETTTKKQSLTKSLRTVSPLRTGDTNGSHANEHGGKEKANDKSNLGGTASSGKSLAQSRSFAERHMKRMAPESVQSEEILPPSAIMCHIMLLHSVLERRANRVMEEHGLTVPQWMALGCIGHCGEKGIRHSELGNRLMLSKAPVTGVVDRLERAGYVRREADSTDRRVSRVVILPQGEVAWKRVRQTLREGSFDVCSSLNDAEQRQLLSLMARLLENVASEDPILSARMDEEN
jgi:MarR family 2-MHQ and catechol resistance regulon transcriptional repressor